MKYFKDATGKIYAYESDGSQDAFILPELIPLTAQEVNELLAPKPIPVTDPRSLMQCSRFQGKVSLLNAGLLTQVEAYFADAATPTLDKLAWQDTTIWYRLSPLVENMGTKFSLTPEQIDALFVYANGVQI